MDESRASRELGERPAREWVGIALRLGGEACLVARDDAREVLAFPPQLTRVPGAKPWIRGLGNVHGALLPVIDLRQYLGGGPTPQMRQTRILVANHRDIPAGFMVDEVMGFRRFVASEFGPAPSPLPLPASAPWITGAYRRGGEQWPVLDLRQLIENPGFLDAAA